MIRHLAILGLVVAVAASSALAQEEKKESTSSARAAARATSSGDGSSERSYRKVVKDGEVVEESGDPRLLEEMRPHLPDLRELLKRARAGATDSQVSSHTRRVVVRNGKVVVDEETVNGNPVPPRGRRGDPGGAPEGDLEDLLEELFRKLEMDLPADLRRHLPDLRELTERASDASGEARTSSHVRRVVVRNGKTLVDEESRDGKALPPRAVKRREPAADEELEDLLEELLEETGKDLPPDLRERLGKALRSPSGESPRPEPEPSERHSDPRRTPTDPPPSARPKGSESRRRSRI